MPDIQDNCTRREEYQWDLESSLRSGDYAYARLRSKPRRQRSRQLERGYDVACHFAQVIAENRREQGQTIGQLFQEQAENWRNETGHLSSVAKMTAHPSYLRIIGLGQHALPLILKELKERPDHWLVALNAITGEDPAPESSTFGDAVQAWIAWGRKKGLC
jgi:hypothetical protein